MMWSEVLEVPRQQQGQHHSVLNRHAAVLHAELRSCSCACSAAQQQSRQQGGTPLQGPCSLFRHGKHAGARATTSTAQGWLITLTVLPHATRGLPNRTDACPVRGGCQQGLCDRPRQKRWSHSYQALKIGEQEAAHGLRARPQRGQRGRLLWHRGLHSSRVLAPAHPRPPGLGRAEGQQVGCGSYICVGQRPAVGALHVGA